MNIEPMICNGSPALLIGTALVGGRGGEMNARGGGGGPVKQNI